MKETEYESHGSLRRPASSELDSGPGDGVVSEGVEMDGIAELAVGVLGVESRLGSLGDTDEVVDGKVVREVLVKVILKVLNKVHVLLNEVVSSNSLESKGLIKELVGVNSNLWVLSGLEELIIDSHGVVVVSLVKGSAELLELESELLLCVWDWGWASIEEDFVVHNLVLDGGSNLVLKSHSLDGGNGQKGEHGEFHLSKHKSQQGSIENTYNYNIIILTPPSP